MRTFASLTELRAAAGEHLGHSEWHTVDQPMINAFAAVTGDQQWIHVDPDRAREGPFGTTIAHGYLTLALAPVLASEIVRVDGVSMGVNYGLNRVRFPAPVPSGSRIRAGAVLSSVEDVPGGLQVVMTLTFEVEASNRPVCVAETVARYYG